MRNEGAGNNGGKARKPSRAQEILGAELEDALDLFSAANVTGTHSGTPKSELSKPLPPVPRAELASFVESEASRETKVVEEAPIYSVSDLSTELREALRNRFGEILVQGEIADYKGTHRSGHLYFALKDASSQIRAVMWKGALQKVPFDIKQGLEVIVTAKLDYYGGSGSLQIVVEKMQPVGMGALQLKLEQLKEKLKAEGLFDSAKKRKVSPLNWRIGIVTSKTTAALQDMLKIYRGRFPMSEIFLFHAAVQGEKAPSEVVAAIARANRFSSAAAKPLDVLIVTRGGGSYEDLFCFNDEKIVRAIVGSNIPTVSAIGHEIDTTLADFAADKRSATPSHAAQETVPEMRLWLERLAELEMNFQNRMRDCITDERQRIDTLYNRLVASAPQARIGAQKEILKQRQILFINLVQRSLERRKAQLARVASMLDALSPLKVIDRGYSLVSLDSNGALLKSIKEIHSGDLIQIKLADGDLQAQVTKVSGKG
jgi:exodeoxyribonuclease VII large subunit